MDAVKSANHAWFSVDTVHFRRENLAQIWIAGTCNLKFAKKTLRLCSRREKVKNGTMFVRFKSESLPVVHILVSPPPLPTPHNPCLFLRILRERRDLPISSVRCRGRHMVERDGSNDVSERLPPRFLLDGRLVHVHRLSLVFSCFFPSSPNVKECSVRRRLFPLRRRSANHRLSTTSTATAITARGEVS